MAGARALWVANGMKREQFGKPIIAVVNSFTQFVPGHTHLHEAGQIIKEEIEKLGCYAAEFNTIAVVDVKFSKLLLAHPYAYFNSRILLTLECLALRKIDDEVEVVHCLIL